MNYIDNKDKAEFWKNKTNAANSQKINQNEAIEQETRRKFTEILAYFKKRLFLYLKIPQTVVPLHSQFFLTIHIKKQLRCSLIKAVLSSYFQYEHYQHIKNYLYSI